MSIVTVSYNPNDFYYVSSNLDLKTCNTVDVNKMNNLCCSDPILSNYTMDKSKCPNWSTNKEKCYTYEVCKNKQNALLSNKIENNHSGSQERFANTKKQYEYEIMKTINITSGIAIFTIATYYMMNTGK